MTETAKHPGVMLSIICPIFNIAERIDAFWMHQRELATSSQAMEIIIVNDGSTDDTSELLMSRLHEVAPALCTAGTTVQLIRQDNKGLSAARNTGLMRATGQYIIFLDDDDFLVISQLPALVQLADHGAVDVISLPYIERTTSDQRIKPPVPSLSAWKGADYFALMLMEHDHFIAPAWAYCYRRGFLIEKDLRFKPGIYHEDCLFTPQAITQANQLTVFDHATYVYVRRPESITLSTDEHKRLKRIRDLQTIVGDLISYRDKNSPVFGRKFKASVNRWAAFLLNYQKGISDGHGVMDYKEISEKTASALLQSDTEYFLYPDAQHHWYRELFESILHEPLTEAARSPLIKATNSAMQFFRFLKGWGK